MVSPYIVEETGDFAVVFKPPKMHTVSAARTIDESNASITLSLWCREKMPSMFDIMHRLDYETHGLVLLAKNEKSYNIFKSAQDNGDFIKEYTAVCSPPVNESLVLKSSHNISQFPLTGFPASPVIDCEPSPETPFIIESFFRSYGQGGKQVRPVIEEGNLPRKRQKKTVKDKGGFYRTEIIKIKNNIFTIRIKRGFRHQIRCHLCWIGYPILNDPLYFHGETDKMPGFLALGSHALYFPDPENGNQREYRVPLAEIIRA